MPENDFDKTVKLPAGGMSGAPKPAEDKTVKLSPAQDKTVKLTAPAAAPSAKPAPAVPQKQSAPPPSTPPAAEKKSALLKTLVRVALIVLIVLGGIWLLLPPWFRGRAEKFAHDGKHQESAAQLKWALRLFPAKKESYLILLGRESRISKDYMAAQESLEKVLAKSADNLEATRELGQVFRDQGQNQKALESFQKCLQIKPEDEEALQWVAGLAFELKKYDVALASYEKITKSSKAAAQDWYHLGASYLYLQKLEEAQTALITANEKDKKLKGVNALLGERAKLAQDWVAYVQFYRWELDLSPDDKKVAETLAESCYQAGPILVSQKKWNDAIQVYQEGLKIASKYTADFHYQLAVLFSGQKKRKESLDHLGKAIESNPALKAQAKKDRVFAAYGKLPEFRKLVR